MLESGLDLVFTYIVFTRNAIDIKVTHVRPRRRVSLKRCEYRQQQEVI